MIEKPTVLVLGAGASYDYGFPTGRGLLVNACADILNRSYDGTGRPVSTPDTPLQRSLIECGFSWDEIVSFVNKLRDSNQPSVDEFVANQPDYVEIGKALIASVILSSERGGSLKRTRDMRWFEYLFQRMTNAMDFVPTDFVHNDLSVVTFNYDRSFEMLLWRSLTNSYPMSNSEHIGLFNSIPIVHVYGSLGDLPFQSEDGISYGSQPNATTVRQCMNNIQIIERRRRFSSSTTSADVPKHVEIFRNADKICFLGFGYNPTNMNLLRIHPIWRVFVSRQNTMYGTAFGREDFEIREAKQHIMEGIEEAGEGRLIIEKKKCLEMLRTHPILSSLPDVPT